MTSKKQKERKNKKRKEIAKNRVLKRREYIRKQRKKAMEDQINEKQAEERAFGKMRPFVKNEFNEEEQKSRDEEIRSKIEHNLKILEALEEEYDRENEARKEINEKLEGEGFKTIKEKMDALHKKALELEGVADQMRDAQEEFNQGKIVIENESTETQQDQQDSQ